MVIGLPPVPALDAVHLWELLLEAFNESGGGNRNLQMTDT